MEKIDSTRFGRLIFGIAIIGLGIEHFIFQDFITGRAPSWPESVPGKLVWAYLSGIIFMAAGISLTLQKKARISAIISVILIFLWALMRHIPILATDTTFLSGSWTDAGKALTLFGGFLCIAGALPQEKLSSNTSFNKLLNLKREFILAGQICLSIYLLITGIQHFIFTDFVASLIPGWFPGDAYFWTYFAAVALITGSIGLLIPKTTKLAAFLSGLMIFSWVWIVHLPRIFLSVTDAIAVFEALAISGIAFVISGCWNKNGLPKQ